MQAEYVRHNPRMEGFDYSTPGAYFVTACTSQRRHLFGEIRSDELEPRLGTQGIVETWLDLPNHFGNIMLDEHVVMPNHFHGLVLLLDPMFCRAELKQASLPEVIGSFKSFAARRYRTLEQFQGDVWQRSFHDHIVRSEFALERIREYIRNNPRQWSLDRDNAQRLGIDPFETWLDEQSQLAVSRPFIPVKGGPG